MDSLPEEFNKLQKDLDTYIKKQIKARYAFFFYIQSRSKLNALDLIIKIYSHLHSHLLSYPLFYPSFLFLFLSLFSPSPQFEIIVRKYDSILYMIHSLIFIAMTYQLTSINMCAPVLKFLVAAPLIIRLKITKEKCQT